MKKILVGLWCVGFSHVGWAQDARFEGNVLGSSTEEAVKILGRVEGDTITFQIEQEDYEASITRVTHHPLYSSWWASGPGFTLELTVVPQTGTLPELELSRCEDAWIAITAEVPLVERTTRAASLSRLTRG
jgi:hypothetical protein